MSNHPIPFFTQEDLLFFKDLHQNSLRVTEISNETRERLKELFAKTNYWAKQTASNVLYTKEDNRWQNSGWLKKYSWARVYDRAHEDKLIYFTFGIDEPGIIIYKLDCQRSQRMTEHLSIPQVEKFDALIDGTGSKWNEISADSISNYSWDDLIYQTRLFVNEHLPLYYEAIHLVWESQPSEQGESSGLFETPPPSVPDDFTTQSPAFEKGVFSGKADYEQQHRTSKRLGDLGEKLVLKIEQEKLAQLGKLHLQAKKVPDGEGYDILSYNGQEAPVYIEVKTTVGGMNTPFFISSNEYLFLKRHPENAYIIRVYNFNPKNGTGKFFKLTFAELERFNVKPSEYKIYLE